MPCVCGDLVLAAGYARGDNFRVFSGVLNDLEGKASPYSLYGIMKTMAEKAIASFQAVPYKQRRLMMQTRCRGRTQPGV